MVTETDAGAPTPVAVIAAMVRDGECVGGCRGEVAGRRVIVLIVGW
jgi:hypothetical protein